ncbi:MAG: RidA family protein [Acidimicrobiales bacterium]
MPRRHARSGSPFEDRYGFSRAVRDGDRVEVAGTAPIPPAGEPVAPTAHAQMLRCGEIALAALDELGASVADVVRTRMFIVDADDADEVGRAHQQLFGVASPVATMVVVAGLLDPAWKVEIEVEAQVRKVDGKL